jgi:hypothetical protein
MAASYSWASVYSSNALCGVHVVSKSRERKILERECFSSAQSWHKEMVAANTVRSVSSHRSTEVEFEVSLALRS